MDASFSKIMFVKRIGEVTGEASAGRRRARVAGGRADAGRVRRGGRVRDGGRIRDGEPVRVGGWFRGERVGDGGRGHDGEPVRDGGRAADRPGRRARAAVE
ncbi:hypothetical protein Mco01_68120 [Microbispora corallina]|uniref:Uncharacterized protein n=1 Tax=Microbispora corallina TaxID=83302 RepID=A0ABQ4G9S0_9ACTN|nr:hypothetical protein Mco01_68120 [Microbispora corallina]